MVADPYLAETKVMLVSLENQMREVELRLFDHEALPFSTYIPVEGFTEQVEPGQTGIAARFSFKSQGDRPDNAYVYFWVPKSDLTVEAIQTQLLGTHGLLAKENWRMTDRTAVVAYPWVKEKIVYEQQTAQGPQSGAIFIGEQDGKAFYAVTSYPLTERDRFESQAALILENLEFRD